MFEHNSIVITSSNKIVAYDRMNVYKYIEIYIHGRLLKEQPSISLEKK